MCNATPDKPNPLFLSFLYIYWLFNFNYFLEVTIASCLLFLFLAYFLSYETSRKAFIAFFCNHKLLLLQVVLFLVLFVTISVDMVTINFSFSALGKWSFGYTRSEYGTVLSCLSWSYLHLCIQGFEKTLVFFAAELKTSGFSLNLIQESWSHLNKLTEGAFAYFLSTYILSRFLFFFTKSFSKTVRKFNLVHPNEHSHTSAFFFFKLCTIFTSIFLSFVCNLPFREALSIAFFLWAPSCLYFGEYSQILTIWVCVDCFHLIDFLEHAFIQG